MDTEENIRPPQPMNDDDEFDVPDEESNIANAGDVRSLQDRRNIYSQMQIRGNNVLSKSVNKTNVTNDGANSTKGQITRKQ